ncbi:MAG: helix-turn-helix domain-containing protein [Bacteroidota bacterium]
MKHITILVPNGEGNNLSSIVGAYKILSRANAYAKQKGRGDLLSIQLAGVSKSVEYYDGLFSVRPHTSISAISKTDLIIIPSLNHNYQEAVSQNKAMIEWIEEQHSQGAEVASICTGAFLLASSGLLNGRSCSTHWAATESFRMLFPEVKLEADKLITDEKGIYTNGGAYSFLNLIIYLVEKYCDRETAIYCSKVFQIEMDRNTQSEFAIFTPQKLHCDEMVKKAQAYIEAGLHEKISMEELSSKFAVSRRNFDRRFIKATGNTPGEYSQRVKIEAAKKAFESSQKTVNEVMYEVGYTDLKAFREVFRKITGISPMEYQGKFNRERV